MSDRAGELARIDGEVRALQQALEALATTVQRIGARLDELLAERDAEALAALSDTETLTVTDDGDSLTLTRADWRRVVRAAEGDDRIGGGLRWRHLAGGRTVVVRRVGGCPFPVYVDRSAVRQWVETGVYPAAEVES